MPRTKGTSGARPPAGGGDAVASYKHPAKRKNLPPAGLEAQGVLKDAPKIRYEYNPHLPPVLRSAPPTAPSTEKRQGTAAVQDASRVPGASEGALAFGVRQSSGAFPGDAASADQLPELLATARQRALSADEAKLLADALRRHEPWLEWSGKREKPWFEVEPVALHMHERISTQAILRVLARQDIQRDLFADPQHDYAQAVQFYQHDVDWANRMILGDSLQVMASLARREDLAGRVQMIYLDPPYGIKFASNFQPQLGQRDVKDREQDLTREPEMVRAYRDTWTLGIHSYLAYLRDRLAMARELLADSGSIFVQISDENLHRVRCVMDEMFGMQNFVSAIAFVKTSGFSSDRLDNVTDYLLWYARDRERVKYRQLFQEKEFGGAGTKGYDYLELKNGQRRRLSTAETENNELAAGARLFKAGGMDSQGATATSVDFEFEGRTLNPGKSNHWKTSPKGLERLKKAEKLILIGNTLSFVRYADNSFQSSHSTMSGLDLRQRDCYPDGVDRFV